MITGFALLVAGGLLLESGISGRSLVDVVRNVAGVSRRLKFKLPDPVPTAAADAAGTGDPGIFGSKLFGEGSFTAPAGSPKNIIDTVVIPIARKRGSSVTAGSVTAANKVHGPTSSDGQSDHQGPPNAAWAADIGSAKGGDLNAIAAALAKRFGFPGPNGLQSKTAGKYRYQLIWQAEGHYDHVHFGVKKV